MKIRFLKDTLVSVEKPKLHEVWDKTFNRWEELQVEEIYLNGSNATLKTYEGDYILLVPANSFERMQPEKRLVSL